MPLDIFSRSKPKEEGKIAIAADFREKNSLVPAELMSLSCSVEFSALPVGDYIAGRFIVERKTMQDMEASIMDRRIFSQVEALKKQENSILLVESSDRAGRMHGNSFKGFFIWCASIGLPVISSSGPKDTASYLKLLAGKREKPAFSLRPYKKATSKKDIVLYVLEGFPGIGPRTADRLIGRFGSLKAIVNAKEEDLRRELGKKYDSFSMMLE